MRMELMVRHLTIREVLIRQEIRINQVDQRIRGRQEEQISQNARRQALLSRGDQGNRRTNAPIGRLTRAARARSIILAFIVSYSLMTMHWIVCDSLIGPVHIVCRTMSLRVIARLMGRHRTAAPLQIGRIITTGNDRPLLAMRIANLKEPSRPEAPINLKSFIVKIQQCIFA
jgi:hypothetical protein